MGNRHLKNISKAITRDIFKVLKSVDKVTYRRKLPGRGKIYAWPQELSHDPDEIPEGFIVRLKIIEDDSASYSIEGLAGDDEGDPCIWLTISRTPGDVRIYRDLHHELLGVVRHELEHLTCSGTLMLLGPCQEEVYGELLPHAGKIMHIINRRRRLFGLKDHPRHLWGLEELERSNNSIHSMADYVKSYDELDAFSRGFYAQACAARQCYDVVARNYLLNFVKNGQMTLRDVDDVLDWIIIWGKDKFPKIRLSCDADP